MVLQEARATLALALPIVGTQLAQIAIHTTDVLLLARHSELSVAAGALGMSAVWFLWVVGLGFAMATPALAAQAIGRDATDHESVRHAVHDGMILTGLLSLAAMVILWCAAPLLRLAGQPAELIEPATLLLQAMSFVFVPSLWFMVLRGFMAALERPRPAMVLSFIAVALNAAVNAVLIFGIGAWEGLGVVGAGVGSSIVNLVTFLALCWWIGRDPRYAPYRISQGWWRTDAERMRAFLKIALPISGTVASEVGLFSVAVFLMGRLGAAELAAHQIALQWAAIAFMVPMGISQAATVRVGFAAGAGDAAGVARAGWVAIAMGTGFMAITAILFWQAGGPLIALFLGEGGSTVYGLAVTYLAWAALFQLVDGAQGVANGALRGLKDTAIPMGLVVFGYWIVGLPVAVWLGLYSPMRGSGVWAGLALGLAVVALLLLWRFAERTRRMRAA